MAPIRALESAREINPGLKVLCLSATSGAGWYDYIRDQVAPRDWTGAIMRMRDAIAGHFAAAQGE